MISGRKLDKRLTIPGLALLALAVIGAEAASAQRAQDTRSSGGGSKASSGSARAPSRSSAGTVSRTSSSTSGPRATSTSRGTATRSRPKAVDTRQSTPAGRGRRSGGGHHRRHHYDLGLYFGYGGYYGYGHYYYPYYYHPFYWGVPYYVPRRAYREYRLGAFDLNVRPKKTEVYLDGQFIGTAGQYDGFPDHLWLEEGSYELIFYNPGLGTERRVLSIYPGVVVDVRLRLQPGESIPPAELSSVTREEGAIAEVRSAYERQRREAGAPPPASAELDTRAAPGRVRLSVLPADASVYLDGRLLGSGDELAKLHAGLVVEAGSHLLEVVRPGYATERREFAVEEGAEIELEVLLQAG